MAAEAVDTTGAGDAFVGRFAVGLAIGLPSCAAVRLGIACASGSDIVVDAAGDARLVRVGSGAAIVRRDWPVSVRDSSKSSAAGGR